MGTPGVASAALSEGDKGKAGLSGKAVVAGAVAAVAGVAVAKALGGEKDSDTAAATLTPVGPTTVETTTETYRPATPEPVGATSPLTTEETFDAATVVDPGPDILGDDAQSRPIT